jgi:hypothetical protein
MLHSLQPHAFVPSRYLGTPWKCPECETQFAFGDGVMFLAHYKVLDSLTVKQGLMCFCSTTCLLGWDHPNCLGPMQ